MKSFQTCQITQIIAQTPTLMLAFSAFTIPFNQFPNRFEMLVGGVILKDICTILQIIFEKRHSIKRC
jgi:hypothetical protein